MENELQWLLSYPALLLVGNLGMFIHFLKKNITGETFTDIKGYFSDHLKSTIIAVATTWIAISAYYMTLKTGQAADIVVVFMTGFMFDSILNKWEKKMETIT